MTPRSTPAHVVPAGGVIAGALVAVWALLIIAAGGQQVHVLGLKLSSAHPWLLLVAGILLLTESNRPGRRFFAWSIRSVADPGLRTASIAAAVVVGATMFASVRYASAVAGGADSYGYISQAGLWRAGSLEIRDDIVARSPWPFAIDTWTPLGYRPTPARDAAVPQYPPGLPLLMASAQMLIGYCGALLIVPISAGIAVGATFLLGQRVFRRPGAALWASLLLASAPVFLYQSVNPMSDVPAAAAWTVALLFVTTDRPLAAGLAIALALAIRPNLAFAAVPIVAWAAVRDLRWALRTIVGIAPAIIGLAIFNQRLYGSPFTFGYGSAADYYAFGYLPRNVSQFVRWAYEGQTPLVFAGLLYLVAPRAIAVPQIARARLLLGGFIAAVVASYLFYIPFPAWWFLRFLLPAWPVLMLLTAAVLHGIAARFRSPWPFATALVCVFVMCRWGVLTAQERFAFDLWRGERRFVDVARYVRDRTEPRAVVLAFQHSGSIRHYAGRLTLRWDLLEPARLDQAVAFLESNGRHPYILVDGDEVPLFTARFDGASRLGKLDWTPMARLEQPPVLVYDPLRRSASDAPDTIRFTGSGTAQWRCDPPAAVLSAKGLQH